MTQSKITKTLLTEDGKVLIQQPDGSFREAEDKTDWNRLESMTDKEIEAAAKNDQDAPPMLGKAQWWKSRLVTGKAQVTIRLDQDILSWFKDQGPGYQTRINAVLRQYKNAHGQDSR